jgi:hypothetical protein
MHWILAKPFQRLQNAVLAVCCAGFLRNIAGLTAPRALSNVWKTLWLSGYPFA